MLPLSHPGVHVCVRAFELCVVCVCACVRVYVCMYACYVCVGVVFIPVVTKSREFAMNPNFEAT